MPETSARASYILLGHLSSDSFLDLVGLKKVSGPPVESNPASSGTSGVATQQDPLPKQSTRSRIADAYAGNEVFRWVVLASPIVFLFLAALWALMAISLHDHWKTALDLFLGTVPPSGVQSDYAAALVLASIGYFFVPAFIGAVVSAVVAVVAVRRISMEQANRTWQRERPSPTEPLPTTPPPPPPLGTGTPSADSG